MDVTLSFQYAAEGVGACADRVVTQCDNDYVDLYAKRFDEIRQSYVDAGCTVTVSADGKSAHISCTSVCLPSTQACLGGTQQIYTCNTPPRTVDGSCNWSPFNP